MYADMILIILSPLPRYNIVLSAASWTAIDRVGPLHHTEHLSMGLMLMHASVSNPIKNINE